MRLNQDRPIDNLRRRCGFIQRGFTLIEIMLVLVVLSIVVGLFAANLSPSPHRQLMREAQRLQAILTTASDEAVMQGVELALAMPDGGYQILQFNPEEMNWADLERRPFGVYQLPEGIALDVTLGEKTLSAQQRQQIQKLKKQGGAKHLPVVLMLSSGEMTPFEFSFSTASIKEQVLVLSDGFSEVEIQ